jgi:hypothetical protein
MSDGLSVSLFKVDCHLSQSEGERTIDSGVLARSPDHPDLQALHLFIFARINSLPAHGSAVECGVFRHTIRLQCETFVVSVYGQWAFNGQVLSGQSRSHKTERINSFLRTQFQDAQIRRNFEVK